MSGNQELASYGGFPLVKGDFGASLSGYLGRLETSRPTPDNRQFQLKFPCACINTK